MKMKQQAATYGTLVAILSSVLIQRLQSKLNKNTLGVNENHIFN